MNIFEALNSDHESQRNLWRELLSTKDGTIRCCKRKNKAGLSGTY